MNIPKIKSALFVCFSFSCMIGHTQTMDEIVNKHLDAIGGKSVIQSTRSLVEVGTITVMGNTGEITTQAIYGKAYKYVADFQGGAVIHSVTEKGGWSVNPMAGAPDPTPMTDEEARAGRLQYAFGGYNSTLIDYAAKGNKLTFEGPDSTAGVKLLKLKVVTRDSLTLEFFFDPVTYYSAKVMISQRIAGVDRVSTYYYKDFRKLDNGLIWAYDLELITPMYTVGITVKDVKLNTTIDPSIFEMPK